MENDISQYLKTTAGGCRSVRFLDRIVDAMHGRVTTARLSRDQFDTIAGTVKKQSGGRVDLGRSFVYRGLEFKRG